MNTPGVQSDGAGEVIPLSMRGREEFDVAIAESGGRVSPRTPVTSEPYALSPGWFESVRIRLVDGRDFTWNDRRDAPQVAIVNQTLARQFWNGKALSAKFG